MTAKQTSYPFVSIDVPHGSHHSEPASGVLCELRIRSLEEDLDAVKWADDGFGLEEVSTSVVTVVGRPLPRILPNPLPVHYAICSPDFACLTRASCRQGSVSLS
jgi:hypothetical protein